MESNKSKVKNLSTGDLVTHILYGKQWVGVIIGFKEDEGSFGNRSEKALVQIQPGTKFEGFFRSKVSPKDMMNESLGYVTTNWLFKIEVKDGNPGSTRNKTP